MSHVMSHNENQHYMQEQQDLQAQIEEEGLVESQISEAEEEYVIATPSSTPTLGTPEEVPAAGASSPPESPEEPEPSPINMEANIISKSDEGSSGQDEEDEGTFQACSISEFALISALEKKVDELVNFLSAKYTAKEPITEIEMLNNIIREYKDYFPVIFKNACEYMEVVFGIEVKEIDPVNHSFMPIRMLDLTYYGKLSDDEGVPKTGLLILILGVIFMEGNRAPEEKIWEMLRMIGMCQRKNFISRDPRRLITRELVQEKYLESRQVPNSVPPRYEFLWGPRAHAETSKMKILEFFSKVSGSYPTSFSSLYGEALIDEEERAQALITSMGDTTP